MYSVKDEKGRAVIETRVCPGRAITEGGPILREGNARAVLDWWLMESTFDGFSGQPNGPPRWPRKGGMLRQDAKRVEAVMLLRSEWAFWSARLSKPDESAGSAEPAALPAGPA